MKLTITNGVKSFRSEDYNWDFNMSNGLFKRWGRTLDEDPSWSPYGPEIADMEISYGAGCSIKCPWCYKGNETGTAPFNTSLEKFVSIFEKFPKYDGEFYVNQVALGLTSVAQSPDLFPICEYLRKNNVIPNATINGADPLTDDEIKKLVTLMGAMAISVANFNYEKSLNLIQRLIKAGAKQLNIHYVLHKKSLDFAYKLLDAMSSDSRLNGLNAIVFLSLKPKNRGEQMEPISNDEYSSLIQYCLDKNIRFGSDSCGAGKLLRSLTPEQYEKIYPYVEPCEATKQSFYCDAEGYYFPCSFMANEDGDWKDGINVLEINDFMKDLWNSDVTRNFRNKVDKCNSCCGGCCHFKI